MSKETFRAVKEAIQAHINEVRESREEEPAMLLDVAIGYAALRHDGERELWIYDYIADETATPHSSVGLFAMASGKLDVDLDQ